MRPTTRPEGGGRPPHMNKKNAAPDITEILNHKEETPTAEQLQKKKRRLILLLILTVLSVSLAVFLTVKAVIAVSQL